MKSVSIVIPNFNGELLLAENLPILLSVCRKEGIDYEIIVVDDGSSDKSIDFIESGFPEVKIIALKENHGFAFACNVGVNAAKGEIVYLLNSDIKVCSGFLRSLLPHFEQADTFAVGSIEVSSLDCSSGDVAIEIPLVNLKFGIFWYWYQEIKQQDMGSYNTGIEVFCVSGGHCAYERSKFISLGGFDKLLRPFYAEDGDICWRAWKQGWKSVLQPASRVVHKHGSTISSFNSLGKIKSIHWKNRTLMTWKNLTSFRLIAKTLFFLLPQFFVCPFIGKKEFSIGIILALKQLSELLKARRNITIKKGFYSDAWFFRRFGRFPIHSPQNILYLHETSNISGAENSLLNLFRHLDSRRFRPICVLPDKGPFFDLLQKEGIRSIALKFPQIRRVRGIFTTIKKLRTIVRDNHTLVIHSNSIRTHLYASIVAKLENISVVWHQRNLITGEYVDPDRLLSFLPDKIFCNSFSIAERFVKHNRLMSKVSVIHNGVDTDYFSHIVSGSDVRNKFGISEEEVVIGIASRFAQDKGHEIFITSAKIIKDDLKDTIKCRFLVAGESVFSKDKWREKYLKEQCKKMNINDKVIFCGFHSEMPPVYAAMDIFVLASFAEPCGRVLLEAMSMSKPIVATRSGGTVEMVIDGQTGILVPPRDERALASALLKLITNPSLAKDMGRRGRERVEKNFTIQRNVALTCKKYDELMYL